MIYQKDIWKKPYGAGTIKALSKSEDPVPAASLIVESWAFRSCAVASLCNFTTGSAQFATPNEFFSSIYRAHKDRYTSWNIVYLLSHSQLIDKLHKWMLECGSKEIDAFENEAHSSGLCHIFRFNLKGAIGKYIDANGNPLNPETQTPPTKAHDGASKEENGTQTTVGHAKAEPVPTKSAENKVPAYPAPIKITL